MKQGSRIIVRHARRSLIDRGTIEGTLPSNGTVEDQLLAGHGVIIMSDHEDRLLSKSIRVGVISGSANHGEQAEAKRSLEDNQRAGTDPMTRIRFLSVAKSGRSWRFGMENNRLTHGR